MYLSGLATLGLAALIGIYLIYITDLKILVIGLIGSRASLILYDFLVFGSFVLTFFYAILKIYPPQTLILFIFLPVAVKAHGFVSRFERLSIPWTNRLHLAYLCLLTVILLIF